MSTPCCVCKASPMVAYRLIPRRDVEPLTDEIRRALAWPGVAAPCEVRACGDAAHQRQARSQGVTVLSVTPLSAGVNRIAVKDGES